MYINSISSKQSNRNKPSFKAREYANISVALNGLQERLNAYRVGFDDTCFLDLMFSKINLQKLCPTKNFSKQQLFAWAATINNSIMMSAFSEPQKSFLLVKDKKPCAIMTYKSFWDCHLDYIASWPVAPNENVKLAGKSMVKLMFYDCIKSGINKITLDLLKKSPKPLKLFYQKLGFIDNTEDAFRKFDMYSPRQLFMTKYIELEDFIKIEEINEPKDVNLKEILDINF